MCAWEVFDPTEHIISDVPPRLSFRTRGSIMVLSESAYVKLGRPEAVRLLHDRHDHLIGVAPGAIGLSTTTPVRFAPRNNTGLVSVSAFLTYFDLHRVAGYWWAARMDETGVLYVDISTSGTPVRRGRHA